MVDSPYQIFVDIDATALEGGHVWIGAAYDNPETNPSPVFWDAALSVPAAQPLRTSGGYIVREGTPANVYTANRTYSVTVNNRRGQRVFYTPIAGGTLAASRITFPIPTGPASIVPGPADNTYTSRALLRTSDTNRMTASLVGDEFAVDGRFNYETTNSPYTDDDGVTTLVPDGDIAGAWVRQRADGITFLQPAGDADSVISSDILADVVSITSFKRRAGETNDTARLTRALASARAVKIPTGTTLTLVSDIVLSEGQALVGDGATSRLRLQTNGASDNIKVKLGSNSTVTGLRIEEIGTTGRTGVYGTIFGEGVSNCIVDAVDVSGSSSAGMLFINCTDMTVSNCNVHDTKADGIHFQRGCKRGVVIGNQVRRVSDDGIAVVSHGYDQYGPVSNFVIANNVITDVQSIGSGIGIIGAFNIQATGNLIENTPLSGIRISSASFGVEGSCVAGKVKVSGNIISNTGTGPQIGNNGGIFVEGARYVDITGNSIFSPTTWGIATSNAVADLSIHDNLIVGGGDVGVFLSFAAQVGYYLQIWTRTDLSDGTSLAYAAGHNISMRSNRIRSPAQSGIYHVGDATRRTDRLTIRDNDLYRIKANPAPGSAYGVFVSNADNIKIGYNDIHAANGLTLGQFVDPANTSGSQGLENSSIPRKTGLAWDAATWLGDVRHYYHTGAPTSADATAYGTFPVGTVVWNLNPASGVVMWIVSADVTAGSAGTIRTVSSTG